MRSALTMHLELAAVHRLTGAGISRLGRHSGVLPSHPARAALALVVLEQSTQAARLLRDADASDHEVAACVAVALDDPRGVGAFLAPRRHDREILGAAHLMRGEPHRGLAAAGDCPAPALEDALLTALLPRNPHAVRERLAERLLDARRRGDLEEQVRRLVQLSRVGHPDSAVTTELLQRVATLRAVAVDKADALAALAEVAQRCRLSTRPLLAVTHTPSEALGVAVGRVLGGERADRGWDDLAAAVAALAGSLTSPAREGGLAAARALFGRGEVEAARRVLDVVEQGPIASSVSVARAVCDDDLGALRVLRRLPPELRSGAAAAVIRAAASLRRCDLALGPWGDLVDGSARAACVLDALEASIDPPRVSPLAPFRLLEPAPDGTPPSGVRVVRVASSSSDG